MDLSFPLPSADDATPLAAPDLARVLEAIGVRAATAADGEGEGELLAPAGGAFSAAMAARLVEWGQA